MQNTDCTFICEQFTEYQDNSLSSKIRARVDTHLASCSSCSEIYQKLAGVIETLHKLPTLQASSDFNSTLLSRIETLNQETVWQKFYHSSSSRVAGYAIAAGLIVAIGINIMIDPISPVKTGIQSNFAGEQIKPNQPTESLAEISDSSANHPVDSLTLQNSTINSQNQSMQLVSGKK
ncbi:MAG: zf-HC2 domain-containing protein [FCB group bacterium]|nr:zf-HC2 domain-containing protein [FCB group bacterium]MBC8377041.1 zf-HC2 domain-containing protein [FCB group bacterium]MBL7028795.1 zf-HC2 domain-containing protein [Candidatus Neomarinimicrobiota bacterium]MBL7121321.1 zf-HC2 domain-containing protein [Candidatus Neomarinimicrobiota bacterium]